MEDFLTFCGRSTVLNCQDILIFDTVMLIWLAIVAQMNNVTPGPLVYFLQAAKADFAGIILWDTVDWTQLCSLHSHTLTVTQMAFSHNGNFLLSVSRDRTWAVYRKKTADQPESGTYCWTMVLWLDTIKIRISMMDVESFGGRKSVFLHMYICLYILDHTCNFLTQGSQPLFDF